MDYSWNWILPNRLALGGRPESGVDLTTLTINGITDIINCNDIADDNFGTDYFRLGKLIECWPQPVQPDDGNPRTAPWYQMIWNHYKLIGFTVGKAAYYHCFPADTIVGQEIPTEIGETNTVFGHDGKLHSVKEHMSRLYNGPLLNFKADGLLPIRCTPEHPFLVLRPYRYPNGFIAKPNFGLTKNNQNHIPKWYINEPQWRKANEIQINDYLVTPKIILSDEQSALEIKPYSEHPALISIKTPAWSDDLIWLFGLYIADGSTLGLNGIGFTLAKDDDCDRLVKTLILFGVEPYVKDYGEYKRVLVASRTLALNFAGWFGKGSHYKHIPEFLMRSWAVVPLIQGIIDGDGHRPSRREEQILQTTSIVLAHQVRLLLLSKEEYPYLGLIKRYGGEYPNAAPSWRVEWRNNCIQYRNIWYKNLYCQAVRTITTEDYSGVVHNIEVEDINSYLANGVVAHNCQAGFNRSASAVYMTLRMMGLSEDDARLLIIKHRIMDTFGMRYNDEVEHLLKTNQITL